MYLSIALKRNLLSNGGLYRASVLCSENSINNDIFKNNGNYCIHAIYRIYATKTYLQGENIDYREANTAKKKRTENER